MCLRLQSTGRGQVGAQVCGFRTKLIPILTPLTLSLPHPLAPLAGARAELRGAGLGPGSRLLLGA